MHKVFSQAEGSVRCAQHFNWAERQSHVAAPNTHTERSDRVKPEMAGPNHAAHTQGWLRFMKPLLLLLSEPMMLLLQRAACQHGA